MITTLTASAALHLITNSLHSLTVCGSPVWRIAFLHWEQGFALGGVCSIDTTLVCLFTDANTPETMIPVRSG